MTNVVIDTRKLDDMIANNPKRLGDLVFKTATQILTAARVVTPRDPARPPLDETRPVSGELRANSDVVKQDALGLTCNVEYYQEYAIYQELGAPAINLPARPFLTPATENASEQFLNELAAIIEGKV